MLDARQVTDREIRLWLWYRRHHIQDERGAYVSDGVTAQALGWGLRKVQRTRAALLQHGLLHVVRRGPSPPRYYPLPLPKESPGTATYDSPNMATQDSPEVAKQKTKDSPHDSPNMAPPIEEPSLNRNRRLTPPQELVDYVTKVGLFGQRPSDYGKQAKRAKTLLDSYALEDLIAATDALRNRFPFSEGRAFDVFDVGKHADRVLAELSHNGPETATPKQDPYFSPAQILAARAATDG